MKLKVFIPTYLLAVLTAILTVSVYSQTNPLGKIVDIGYAKMHLNYTGNGSPTVILDAGAGSWSIHWFEVQKELSKYTRVCSYDRLGLGWSSLGEMPRTVEKDASDLRELLQKSGEKKPFIIAGHSYAGYIARVYQDMFPDNIAGIVLIDSAYENQWDRLPVTKQMMEIGLKAAKDDLEEARSGQLKKKDYKSRIVPEMLTVYQAQMVEVKTHQTSVSVLENIFESADKVRKTRKLGNLPLLVLSAGKSFAAFLEDNEKNRPLLESFNKGWMEMQTDLARLSTNSQHIIVSPRDSHRFNRDNPKLIAYSIILLAEKTR